MTKVALYLPLALSVATSLTVASTKNEERIQLWPYRDEEPLDLPSLEPTVQSVMWRDGDLEILFIQAAPCGPWMPGNPVW